MKSYQPTAEEKERCCSTVFSFGNGEPYYLVNNKSEPPKDSAPAPNSMNMFQKWTTGSHMFQKEYVNQMNQRERQSKAKLRNDFIREVNHDFKFVEQDDDPEHPFIKSVFFHLDKEKYGKTIRIRRNAPFGVSKMAVTDCEVSVTVNFNDEYFPKRARFCLRTDPKKGEIEKNWLVRVILSSKVTQPVLGKTDEELQEYMEKVERLRAGKLSDDEKEVYLLFGVKTGLREDKFVLDTEKWKSVQASQDRNRDSFKEINGRSMKILKRNHDMGKFLANKAGIDQRMALVQLYLIICLGVC